MPEFQLNYWREDPLLNEHHWHWHLVYPYAGRIDPQANHTAQELLDIAAGRMLPRLLLWNDRHGELFAYMHRQLLARYAAERLSSSLAMVVPLADLKLPIPDGYSPGVFLRLDGSQGVITPGNRPNNAVLSGLTAPNPLSMRPGARIDTQELFLNRVAVAISSSGAANRPSGISDLSELLEPTHRRGTGYFGAIHNDGHLLISMHNNDHNHPGCLFWEETAIRDPIFYRWHAHLDGLFSNYQDGLDPYDFSDLPPISARRIQVIGDSGISNELHTEMRNRTVTSAGAPAQSMQIDYLSHEDFIYEIEATNQSDSAVTITVRIFLCPEDSINDRRAWIEMDKFRHSLAARATGIIHRESKSSSVIRHPVLTADVLEGRQPAPIPTGVSPGCRCGWPYTLLLPRGKPGGMSFRFMVLFTPGADTTTAAADQANSASYCGLRDTDYPDSRPMGYPFDRPLRFPIRDFVSGAAKPHQLASTLANIVHI